MSGTRRWRLSGKRNSLGGCSCNLRGDPALLSLLPYYMAGWPRGMTIELLTHQSPVRIPVGSEERQRTGKRREASGAHPREIHGHREWREEPGPYAGVPPALSMEDRPVILGN